MSTRDLWSNLDQNLKQDEVNSASISECCSECCQTQHIHTQHTGFRHGANFHSEQERKWRDMRNSDLVDDTLQGNK